MRVHPDLVRQLHGDKRGVGKFEEQFPEAIDLLARALRAGHAFTTGLSMVAEEMPEPVGTEFRLAYDRQNFGMPMGEALKSLGERVPLLDARFFVTAVLTQREAGGNLAEVLDNLARVIRERFKVKRQVRVITAHARITGWVLALLPPALGVVLTLLSPEHMSSAVDGSHRDQDGGRRHRAAGGRNAPHPQARERGVLAWSISSPLGLTVLFLGVAVLTGLVASLVLTRSSAERRRIREMATAASLASSVCGISR